MNTVLRRQMMRLANVLGMDIGNEQDVVGLLDAISSVTDADAFISWMIENRDTVEYANRREKLSILTNRYKKTIDTVPVGVLEGFCTALTDKFKKAKSVLRDNEVYLDRDLSKLTMEGKQYFTDKEIRLMNATGGLNRLIFLHDMGTLYEKLYSESVKMTLLSNSQRHLTDGRKKINKILEEM